MRVLKLFLTLFSGIAIVFPFATRAQILCKSPSGGQCVDLAAAAASKAIPGLEFLTGVATPSDLFSKIYTYGVSLVALTAFFMFTYGAIRYMMPTEGGTAKAKEAMYNAVLGLVVALVSYLTLLIINPNIVKNFDISLPPIQGLKASEPSPSTKSSGAGPSSTYIGKDLGESEVEKARKVCEDSGGNFVEFTDFSGTRYSCIHE